MAALLEKGADPNARLKKKVWYSGYSFDLSGVDEIGATAFWRAAYASDVDAMKLLVARGADPNIPSTKGAGRPRTADVERDVKDVATTPPVPVGGYGERPGPAHPAVAGGARAARKTGREEQPQVRVLLTGGNGDGGIFSLSRKYPRPHFLDCLITSSSL